MKKQVIFIYDSTKEQLIHVCDVRDLTPEQFASFSKEANANLKKLVKEKREHEAKKEKETKDSIKKLEKEIENLKLVINHLLGWAELTEQELEDAVGFPPNESEDQKYEN